MTEQRPSMLQGESFNLLVLPLINLRDFDFFTALVQEIERAPYFFQHAPVVLDLQGLTHFSQQEFAALVERMRECELMPVGVRNATEAQNAAAIAIGLGVFPMWRADGTSRPLSVPPEPAEAAARITADSAAADTLLIHEPIRCGQQVRAQQGDLVALRAVSTGAEIYTRGHIHVYGALRGRAFAGCDGDPTARIFCHSFEPELISIAGQWVVRDDIDERLIGQAVQISRAGRRLVIETVH